MKIITAEELEAVISEIGVDSKEFRKWVKETYKNKALLDLVLYRLSRRQPITDIDLLYYVYVGVKIGRGQVWEEDLLP